MPIKKAPPKQVERAIEEDIRTKGFTKPFTLLLI
jgi:hypothetical protein